MRGWAFRAAPGAAVTSQLRCCRAGWRGRVCCADPKGSLAPCSSPLLCKARCRLTAARWPLLGSSKCSERRSLPCWHCSNPGRWLVAPALPPGVCVPPAVFSMPRCFLLQVLTPWRSGKGTELAWSLLSAPTMHSEFLQASGKCFFPYISSSTCQWMQSLSHSKGCKGNKFFKG